MRQASSDAVYFLTSAIAHVLFKEAELGQAPDALFYPSVVFRGGVNFAITPQAAATRVSLVLGKVKIVRITEVLGYGLYRYDVLATLASCEEEHLAWMPARGIASA